MRTVPFSQFTEWIRNSGFRFAARVGCGLVFALVAHSCLAQADAAQPQEAATAQNQLAVNWLYGAYIPKDAPRISLTGEQRYKLYVRQSFTTPGIYVKTGFFAVHDEITGSPPGWNGIEGFGERVGTRHTENLLLNSFTSLGDAAVGWEPRYDRCRCDGFWPRARHAIVRNFVTYDRSEQHLRPQIMPYVASFGAGAIVATWQPGNPSLVVKGYQGVLTQVWVGSFIYLLGEFAPDVMRKLHKNKKEPL
jgi:hypothetical protein